MKITKIDKIEDCFDGSMVYKYEFAETFDEKIIRKFAVFGELEYFADFPRPLFRVRGKNGIFIQGVAQSNYCRVILSGKDKEFLKQQFEKEVKEININC